MLINPNWEPPTVPKCPKTGKELANPMDGDSVSPDPTGQSLVATVWHAHADGTECCWTEIR